MNLKELRELIELVSEKGIAEFEMERQGFRLRICRNKPSEQPVAPLLVQAHAPLPQDLAVLAATPTPAPVAPLAPVAPAIAVPVEEPLNIIKSPIVGTFYRAPSPQAEVFVKVGDRVENDTVVCIIEAMKLMNEIQAEMSGIVAKIYVENGQPVEYGQPLFGIRS
ncbi:MAG: acetyl-CoA carboxylase biotin carboxyl carrier protein [Acidobacteria bacterium]|nr:acetyl-CoA carboxylase biotin carboxyl carrier protein [Acidobacteriota bacterium]